MAIPFWGRRLSGASTSCATPSRKSRMSSTVVSCSVFCRWDIRNSLNSDLNAHSIVGQEIERRIDELCDAIEKEPYVFDRRFLFRILSMGHSQFAEFIGARGPNTQINSACASTTQAVALAEDWIHAGRCRRVIVVAADDVTTDNLIDWMGAGFLASGAAATDD